MAIHDCKGPKRHQLGLLLGGTEPAPPGFSWEDVPVGGKKVGDLTNCVWSPRLKQNIGYPLNSVEANAGDRLEVVRPAGNFAAELAELPFI